MYSYNINTFNEFIIQRQGDKRSGRGSEKNGSICKQCCPVAFIAEQAGGKASDGKNRIMNIKTESLH